MTPADAPSPDRMQALDDLAYLKGLVAGGGGRAQQLTGQLFVAGGAIYGAQVLFHWLQAVKVTPDWPLLNLLASLGPTALFLTILTVVLVRAGPNAKPQGATARAFDAVFAAVGVVNLALVLIFAPPAIQSGNLDTWLFFPAVVFALQGGAWLVAWQMRRKLWLLVTAVGWLVSAVAMGFTRGSTTYVLIAGVALILFMLVPGLIMMRRRDA